MLNDNYYVASGPQPLCCDVLKSELTADVTIIGGGFTGLSAAIELASSGFRVVLLEAHHLGWGASGRNGGQVGSGFNKGTKALEKQCGKAQTKLLWNLAEEAKQLLRTRVEQFSPDCHFKPGNLLAITKKRYVKHIESEVAHLREHYSYDQKRMLDTEELRTILHSDRYCAGCIDHGGGHLHPLQLIHDMGKAALAAGVKIFEQSGVIKLSSDARNLKSGRSYEIRTRDGKVKSEFVLLCGNAYLKENLVPSLTAKTMPINAYMIATSRLNKDLKDRVLSRDWCVETSKFVIDYYRFSHDDRLLFGGGESYGYGHPPDIREFVRKYLLKVFPQLEDVAIDFGWSGRISITSDRIPDFGRIGTRIYYAQGFSGHGLALTHIAGKLMAELVSGQAKRFDLIAGLKRPNFPGGTMLRNPLHVLGMTYYALKDRM